ncbi:MAG: ferredoxin [Verrucomicrobiae bacterium]|nr:ferredoxin [Verrucomicrobiae bacterium]
MSQESFQSRMPENVPGKFYVGYWCTDCDFCRATASANFGRVGRSAEGGGYSYVMKQPSNPEEDAACREAMEYCCVRAIFADGDQFDWTAPRISPGDGGDADGDRDRLPRDGGCCKTRKPSPDSGREACP